MKFLFKLWKRITYKKLTPKRYDRLMKLSDSDLAIELRKLNKKDNRLFDKYLYEELKNEGSI